MLFDHVSYAAEPDGLHATTKRLAAALGVAALDGGCHPRFGTRNMLLPMRGLHYVEVVEVLDHPVADKCEFGTAVRQRSAQGGGWLGWTVSTTDLTASQARLGRTPIDGYRHRPDGLELRWKQLGDDNVLADPQLPFIISWQIEDAIRPGADRPTEVDIRQLTIAGHPDRVRDWLGVDVGEPLRDVQVRWVAPHGSPGLQAVEFETPHGRVTI